ncbi:unnamed protein product [Owenia fusiformis]|uniref:Tetraspanin n=1 Tax=Owenia fusiformis TaxID=6347 RepID=A0A8J1Y5N0_OWEFU|nr:unnamed protein product [Owenia fusiformis]
MVEGGMKCVKYLLFAFNLIFFLAGLGLIIAGVVVQTTFKDYVDFLGGQFSAAAIVLVVVGVIIFIVGFFGCCGAWKENYCMTMTFAALLTIIFIVEIAVGIAAYVMRDQVRTIIQEKMSEGMQNYGKSGKDGVTQIWDKIQQDFQCCGTNNYTDWAGYNLTATVNNVTTPITAPASCCDSKIFKTEPTCASTVANLSGTPKGRGCLSGFEDWIKKNIIIIGGVGIGLAFVQVLGIILACCLGRTIKKEYEVV